MALLVGRPVEAEGLLAVRLVGDDGFGAARAEPLSQFSAVISSVAEHFLGCFGAPDQALGWRTIVRLAAGQQDGKKTTLSIRDCVDFRIAAAARASNSLTLFPLFAPEAERCALTWVASIICVSVDRPRAASSRNNRSHTPRSAQRTKRL